MRVTTLSQRGFEHPQRNEDNFCFREITLHGETILIGAVFDGCSTGKDSWFASKLFSLAFSTVAEEFNNHEIYKKGFLKTFTYQLCAKISTFISLQIFKLTDMDLLSTMIIFLYEPTSKKLQVKFFGDGNMFIYETKEALENDENNSPDYLGYYMANFKIQDWKFFEKLWDKKREEFRETSDFSISTDGVGTFKRNPAITTDLLDPVSYLVFDDFLKENPAAMPRKMNLLYKGGWHHGDDITILRIINN